MCAFERGYGGRQQRHNTHEYVETARERWINRDVFHFLRAEQPDLLSVRPITTFEKTALALLQQQHPDFLGVSLCNIFTRLSPTGLDLVLYRCNQQHKSHSHSYIVNVVPHERYSSFIKSWKEKKNKSGTKKKKGRQQVPANSSFRRNSTGLWFSLFRLMNLFIPPFSSMGNNNAHSVMYSIPFFLNRFFLGRKNELKQNYGTWNCFLLVLLLLLEKRKKDFFCCVSDGWIFSRRQNSPTGKNNNVRGCSSLLLLLLFFFFSKNGLGQDEQLLTIRHFRIIVHHRQGEI